MISHQEHKFLCLFTQLNAINQKINFLGRKTIELFVAAVANCFSIMQLLEVLIWLQPKRRWL
ncbi:hypothetical protein EAW55_09280 [Legionella jordanis]|nr:hypothetical protein EAW55_09280 [Legionella jordanis]RMX21726.1 hypothetical protein EAS68_02940 [Legionella jordanis]